MPAMQADCCLPCRRRSRSFSCMSQLDEKRRLLYWKFCRTIRVNPAWER
ncbi:TPA: hypothetical protein G8N71_003887 [Salmonella enterica]|nr:hypothetical protein [Salmonella enterica subsp. houtenae serovar 40:z4,z24:-]EEE5220527.1 hypothetical protein [Salmonella enterica]HAF6302511.1 hypothetical protein [Salmonella enterica]